MRTYQQALKDGIAYLENHYIEDSKLDAWLLLEHVSGMDRACYLLHMNDIILENELASYWELLRKRGQHIPLQHLTGIAWFMGYPFYVSKEVLAPRPDTELLVERALAYSREGDRLLDMCTGSGCILLSMMKEGRKLVGTGVDLSEAALAVAKKNAEKLGLLVSLQKSDLFAEVEGIYDMILSNPPYIPSGDIGKLMEEVRDHEPRMALDGLEDGLHFYRRIGEESPAYLKKDGYLGLEIGWNQGQEVKEILLNKGFRQVEVIKDLAGLDRVVWAQRPYIEE